MPETIRELADAFRNVVRHHVVLIERFYVDDRGEPSGDVGTGFSFAEGHQPNGALLNIATAGHMLTDSPEGSIEWRISRWVPTGNGAVIHRNQFSTTTPLAEHSSFLRPKYWETFDYPDTGRGYDIGGFAVFNKAKAVDGTALSLPFLDTQKHPIIRVAPRQSVLKAGARVAWAGFPGMVHELLNSHQLCYFEGVISSSVFRPNAPPLYLVDGYSAPGMSGGPVWCCGGDGEPTIVGVIAGYIGQGNRSADASSPLMPGLCYFTPINVLCELIESRKERENTSG